MAKQKLFFGWWILATSAITIACSGVMLYGLPAFYPTLLSQFGWSRAGITFGHFITLATNSVMQIVFAVLIDRRGARRVLVIGTLITGTACLLFRFVNGLNGYYLACFFLGFGWSAMAYVPNSALVSRWFQRRRGLALGIVTAFSALGGAISAPVITYLILHTGWRNAYTWIGAACLAIPLVPLLTIVRERPQDMGLQPDGDEIASDLGKRASSVTPDGTPEENESFFSMIRHHPAAMVLMVCLFFLGMFIGSTLQHLILYLRGEGFSPYAASVLASLEMIFGIAGRLGFGLTTDKISLRVSCLIFFLLLAASSGLVFLVTVTGMVFVFAICHGLGHGAVTAFIPTVFSTLFPSRHMAKNIGLGFTVYALGVASGPPLLGWIFDTTGSYFYGFLMNAVLVIAATVAVLGFSLGQKKTVEAAVSV